MYVYLRTRDDFNCMPVTLVQNLGVVEFSMQLELSETKKLARENPRTVMENLEKQGFHLQMPGDTPVEELLAKISREQCN